MSLAFSWARPFFSFSSSRVCDCALFFNTRDEISFLFPISSRKRNKTSPRVFFGCLSKYAFGQGINFTRQQKLIRILSRIIQNVNIHNKQFPKPKEIARRESFGRDRSLKASYFSGLLKPFCSSDEMSSLTRHRGSPSAMH